MWRKTRKMEGDGKVKEWERDGQGMGKGRAEEEGEECSRRKECYKRIFKY